MSVTHARQPEWLLFSPLPHFSHRYWHLDKTSRKITSWETWKGTEFYSQTLMITLNRIIHELFGFLVTYPYDQLAIMYFNLLNFHSFTHLFSLLSYSLTISFHFIPYSSGHDPLGAFLVFILYCSTQRSLSEFIVSATQSSSKKIMWQTTIRNKAGYNNCTMGMNALAVLEIKLLSSIHNHNSGS